MNPPTILTTLAVTKIKQILESLTDKVKAITTLWITFYFMTTSKILKEDLMVLTST